MPAHRHSADLRGRRQDLGIGIRDMAAGLGIGLGRLVSMEDGTASEDDKTFYRTWLSRITKVGRPARGISRWNVLATAVGSNDPANPGPLSPQRSDPGPRCAGPAWP